MRIVFMGTPGFAVESLDKLVKNNYNIVGVVTAADKPAGRGQQMQQSDVKKYALEHGLKILQPEKLKDENFLAELKALNADLQIVVAFRMLPEAVWNMPRLGTYNLHASLLPKYRGAAPINWAIINGEKETGVTTFKIQHEIDTGNILFQEKVSISAEETAGELHDKLKTVGAELLLKTVCAIEKADKENTKLDFLAQDDAQATHAPKIFRDTCRINWSKSLEQIHDLVRGLSPHPGAWCEIGEESGERLSLRVLKALAEKAPHSETNGSLMTDGKMYLKAACRGGYLNILQLQLQGKKVMKTDEFLRGFKMKGETRLF
jgi:methionyl-tRNA formyltransferase